MFPHSDICGSMLICSSPQLFAAYHVLLRLLMPRHSPCALSRLTFLNDLSFSLAILNYVSKLFSVICFIPVTLIYISLYIRAFFLKKPDFFLLFSLFNSQTSVVTNVTVNTLWCSGGGKEIRTPDPLLARQVLSQLSYTPILNLYKINDYSNEIWWAEVDSNHRPHAYQACALTC